MSTRVAEHRPEPQPSEPHGGLRGLIRDLWHLCTRERPILVILVTVPVALTLLEYYGMPWHYTRHIAGRDLRIVGDRTPPFTEWLKGVTMPGPPELQSYVWWGIAILVTMVLLPVAAGALAGFSPRQLGVKVKGTLRDAPVYLVLFLVFFPVLWLASHSPEFQATYPFYPRQKRTLGWDYVAFEAIYCLQFFAVEFFFRGFMVLGLKPRIGIASVLVMLAPYCMIHYYKPFPEAMGAIGAGIVLGVLAWRTGTVIYGWFLHYGVALSMNLLSLSQTNRL
jgi:hypothetical protein